MKTIQLMFACFALFLISCNSDSKPAVVADTPSMGGEKISAAAQKNLDAMHVVDKAFKTGDVSGIDSVVAADFVDHTDKGTANRDSLKAAIVMSAKDKTAKMETIKEVADDEYAFAMMHMTGTGDGVMMPAGPYDMHSTEIVRFKDGKAVEHWSYMEMGEIAKIMSKMMPPPPVKKKKK